MGPQQRGGSRAGGVSIRNGRRPLIKPPRQINDKRFFWTAAPTVTREICWILIRSGDYDPAQPRIYSQLIAVADARIPCRRRINIRRVFRMPSRLSAPACRYVLQWMKSNPVVDVPAPMPRLLLVGGYYLLTDPQATADLLASSFPFRQSVILDRVPVLGYRPTRERTEMCGSYGNRSTIWKSSPMTLARTPAMFANLPTAMPGMEQCDPGTQRESGRV